MFSWTTLLFEVVIVPLVLFVPPVARPVALLASVGLHLGIGVAQSAGIGLAFLPNIATYALGFSAHGPVLLTSFAWWIALTIAVAPAVVAFAVRRNLLPEDWPCTNFALFAWSSRQWEFLFERFRRGKTRLVLCTAASFSGPPTPEKLRGIHVTRKADPAQRTRMATNPGGALDIVVHDAWEQIVGETLVFPTLMWPLLEGAKLPRAKPGAPTRSYNRDDWLREFAVLVSKWLRRARLIEHVSGNPVLYAVAVRVDADNVVTDVL